MSYNNLKKKKSITIFSDGSFSIIKNSVLKRIIFFEKDERNSSLWLQFNKLQKPINNFSYINKFLIKNKA
jgi:hypothetical protein